jgi:death-on-curing protein
MDHPLFLTMDEILNLHSSRIALYGGSDGVRDIALLQSAIAMPDSGFGGEFFHSDLPAMAAAYLFHIVCNHPFIDGNTRRFLLIVSRSPRRFLWTECRDNRACRLEFGHSIR